MRHGMVNKKINRTSEQTPFSIQPFARLNFLVDYAEIDADFGYDDVLNINIEQCTESHDWWLISMY